MRRKDREVTDTEQIREILTNAKILHLGMFDDEYPYIVPMHYGFEYDGSSITFYVHCAKEGHKLDLIRNNSSVFAELETDIELISGKEACNYGSAYSSVMLRGKAEIIQDPKEKMKGLSLLMKTQTGKDFEISEQMASAVTVIRITSDSYTAKSRPKPSHMHK